MSPITFNAWYCWAPPITNCISLFLSHLKKQLPKTQIHPCWEVNEISNKALRKPFNGSAGFNAKPIQAFIQELTQTDCTIANIICSCANTNETICQILGVNKSKKAFTAPSLATHIRCTCKMTYCCLQVIQATCVGSLSFIWASRPMNVSVLCQRVTLNYSNGEARWGEKGRESKKNRHEREKKEEKWEINCTVLNTPNWCCCHILGWK